MHVDLNIIMIGNIICLLRRHINSYLLLHFSFSTSRHWEEKTYMQDNEIRKVLIMIKIIEKTEIIVF